jgi:hypothetical protein
MIKRIKRFLGWLGFGYCQIHGTKLKVVGTHGWYDDNLYGCDECELHD